MNGSNVLTTRPDTATQTTNANDWWQWSAGDVMQITLPLLDAQSNPQTLTYTFAYDAADQVNGCAYDFCGVTGTTSFYLTSGGSQKDVGTMLLPAHSGEQDASVNPYDETDTYFGFSVTSLAGEFSLAGYRIYTNGGVIDGTGAGPLDQSSVVSAEQALAGGGPRPINSADDVVGGLGSATTYVFDGGVLNTAEDVAADFTITNNGGAMSIAEGSEQTFSGVLSDANGASGKFKKAGAGRLVVTGVNTHTGGTEVEAGTLVVAADTAFGADGTAVTLNGGVLEVAGDLTTARGITVGANDGTIKTVSGKTVVISSAITGAGDLNLEGSGTVALTGASNITGALNARAGVVKLNGSIQTSGIYVANGAMLGGSGSVVGNVVSDGNIAAGNSPGTLTVAGDVTLNATSVLDVDVDGRVYSAAGGAGSYDRVVVEGANSKFTAGGAVAPIVRGITGDANNTFDAVLGDAFRIVQTKDNANGIAGAFSTVTNPATGLPANTRFEVLYGSDYIDLVLTPNSFKTFAEAYGMVNMINYAEALDAVRPSAGTKGTDGLNLLSNELYKLNSTQLSLALLQLSGQIHAFALADMRYSMSTAATDVLNQSGSNSRIGENFWVDASGYTINYSQDTVASSSSNASRSLWVGSDIFSNANLTFGAGVGLGDSTIDAGLYGTADRSNRGIAFYLNGERGELIYQASLVAGRSNISGSRTTTIGATDYDNAFSTNADSATVKGRLGYGLATDGNVRATAWFGGEFNVTKAYGYTETGAALTALTIDPQLYRTGKVDFSVNLTGDLTSDSKWHLNGGVSRILEQGSPYVSRKASLHGATWNVLETSSGYTTGYTSIGVSRAANESSNVWAEIGLSKTRGSLARQAGLGFDVRW